MMKLLMSICLTACSNSAITYMHRIDPNAECHQVYGNHAPDNDNDSATCVSKNQIYFCIATIDYGNHCWPMLTAQAEQSVEVFPR
jgi:hypothetical protein